MGDENEKLKEELKKNYATLEKESVEHVFTETTAQSLKEKLDFLKLLWEQVIPSLSFPSLPFPSLFTMK